MIVNFRAHGISRDAHKLTRIPTLNLKKKKVQKLRNLSKTFNKMPCKRRITKKVCLEGWTNGGIINEVIYKPKDEIKLVIQKEII
jgi:hypothetical protein